MGQVLVLLSGGLDSATNLAMAAERGLSGRTLTIAYGQRAEAREITAAQALSKHYGFSWSSLDLRWLGRASRNALTNTDSAVPDLDPAHLDDQERGEATARAVWVANRNGLFLNAAAAIAEAASIEKILVGFNREEAATFPDNSADFIWATNQAFRFSTMGRVEVDSFTIDFDKPAMMREARRLGLPLELVWSCYQGAEKPCGICESCRRFQRAQEMA